MAIPKSAFWKTQPVFHWYYPHYYFKTGQEIIKVVPPSTCPDVITKPFDQTTDAWILPFIQKHYLQNGDNAYKPTENSLYPYLTSTTPTYLSTIYGDKGIITSRATQVYVNGQMFVAYYADYLCVDVTYRGKGLAPKLIENHYRNHRRMTPAITISIFKREDELTGIVPICVYNTYGYRMTLLCKTEGTVTKLNTVDTTTLCNQFKVCIVTDINHLIKTNNIMVITDIDNNLFFFRNTDIYMEGGQVISLFASVQRNPATFYTSFQSALQSITNSSYTILSVENISHNCFLTQLLPPPIITSSTAYYFYNYIYCSIPSSETIVIN